VHVQPLIDDSFFHAIYLQPGAPGARQETGFFCTGRDMMEKKVVDYVAKVPPKAA
jgi:hypothetical protein